MSASLLYGILNSGLPGMKTVKWPHGLSPILTAFLGSKAQGSVTAAVH